MVWAAVDLDVEEHAAVLRVEAVIGQELEAALSPRQILLMARVTCTVGAVAEVRRIACFASTEL